MNTGPVLVDVAVKDLSGPPLNWAVFCAVYTGMQPTIHVIEAGTHEMRGLMKPINFPRAVSLTYSGAYGAECNWNPSGDWEDGGPLLDKYVKSFGMVENSGSPGHWRAFAKDNGPEGFMRLAGGASLLEAACRAIVTVHLGDIVKVPACLVMP